MKNESVKPVIGIYHNKDLDGICSGAIIKKKYPHATMIGWDYGEPIPEELVDCDCEVIMADISFPMKDMDRVAKWVGKNYFTWIDHHKTAIEDYRTSGILGIDAFVKEGVAACELTWIILIDEPIPYVVRLLGAYDTWRQNDPNMDWDAEILPYQYGMRSIVGLSVDSMVEYLDQIPKPIEVLPIISAGKAILIYQNQQNQMIAEQAAFAAILWGHIAICLNTQTHGSAAFHGVYAPENYELMLTYCYDGKGNWKFSLRTTYDHIDVSKIAKLYGGGGHAKAAGFSVKNLEEVFGQ